LSDVIGKSRSHLANTLRLLKLPDSVQDLVRSGELSAGHARALIGRSDAEALAGRIVKDGLSVREVEALTQEHPPAKPKHKKSKDADTRAAESELHDALGLNVEIKAKARRASLNPLHDAPSARGRPPPAAAAAALSLSDGEKLLGAKQRFERDAGLGIEVGGALAAIENRDHQRNRRPASVTADRIHR
jgi:hypothetical protein